MQNFINCFITKICYYRENFNVKTSAVSAQKQTFRIVMKGEGLTTGSYAKPHAHAVTATLFLVQSVLLLA